MRWRMFFLGLVLADVAILSAEAKHPKYQISDAEGVAAAARLDEIRATTVEPATKMKKIAWYPELAADMRSYIASIDPKTLMASSPQYPPVIGYTHNTLLMHMAELPAFAQYKPQNCRVAFFDTFDSSHHWPFLGIVNFRLNEALEQKCFVYGDCSDDAFDDFNSCDRLQIHKPGSKCQGAGRYYGEFTVEEAELLGCAALGTQGPSSPKPGIQDDSFACIICYGEDSPKWPPPNDQPFEVGPRASQCTSYNLYTEAKNGLCVMPSSGRRLEDAKPKAKYQALRGV